MTEEYIFLKTPTALVISIHGNHWKQSVAVVTSTKPALIRLLGELTKIYSMTAFYNTSRGLPFNTLQSNLSKSAY